MPQQKFWAFLAQTKAFKQNEETFTKLWNLTKDELFRYDPPYALIEMNERNGKIDILYVIKALILIIHQT